MSDDARTQALENAHWQLVEDQSAEATTDALRILSECLDGVEVVAVRRRLTEPRTYVLETKSGLVGPLTARGLRSQSEAAAALLDAAGVNLGAQPPPRWTALVQVVVDLAVDYDLGPDATEVGALDGWLLDYLAVHPPAPGAASSSGGGLALVGDDGRHRDLVGDQKKEPIRLGNQVDICTASLLKWINEEGVRLTVQQLAVLLDRYGATKTRYNVGAQSDRTTRRGWTLPSGAPGQVGLTS